MGQWQRTRQIEMSEYKRREHRLQDECISSGQFAMACTAQTQIILATKGSESGRHYLAGPTRFGTRTGHVGLTDIDTPNTP